MTTTIIDDSGVDMGTYDASRLHDRVLHPWKRFVAAVQPRSLDELEPEPLMESIVNANGVIETPGIAWQLIKDDDYWRTLEFEDPYTGARIYTESQIPLKDCEKVDGDIFDEPGTEIHLYKGCRVIPKAQYGEWLVAVRGHRRIHCGNNAIRNPSRFSSTVVDNLKKGFPVGIVTNPSSLEVIHQLARDHETTKSLKKWEISRLIIKTLREGELTPTELVRKIPDLCYQFCYGADDGPTKYAQLCRKVADAKARGDQIVKDTQNQIGNRICVADRLGRPVGDYMIDQIRYVENNRPGGENFQHFIDLKQQTMAQKFLPLLTNLKKENEDYYPITRMEWLDAPVKGKTLDVRPIKISTGVVKYLVLEGGHPKVNDLIAQLVEEKSSDKKPPKQKRQMTVKELKEVMDTISSPGMKAAFKAASGELAKTEAFQDLTFRAWDSRANKFELFAQAIKDMEVKGNVKAFVDDFCNDSVKDVNKLVEMFGKLK